MYLAMSYGPTGKRNVWLVMSVQCAGQTARPGGPPALVVQALSDTRAGLPDHQAQRPKQQEPAS